jgi:hypothetical protein
MNPSDSLKLPILAAMNVHALHRRGGPFVLKSEVEEALLELSLETASLPRGRLLNAERVEGMLTASGVTVELVRRRSAAFIMLASPEALERLAARTLAAADPKERDQLEDVIVKALYGANETKVAKNGRRALRRLLRSKNPLEIDSKREEPKGTKRNQNPRKTAQKP